MYLEPVVRRVRASQIRSGSWWEDPIRPSRSNGDYRTEIHPPRLVMTLRDAASQAWSKPCQVGPNAPNCINGTVTIPARPGWTDTLPGLGSVPVRVTRADVFASSDGGEAREQETCFAPPVCVPADWYQPLKSKNYDLFVPAPPQPDAGAQLVTKLIPRPFLTASSDNDPGSLDLLASQPNRFTFTEENGQSGRVIHIHVNLDNFTEPATHLYGFGFTYEVGWNRPATVVPPSGEGHAPWHPHRQHDGIHRWRRRRIRSISPDR
jgi:hypothetical protein